MRSSVAACDVSCCLSSAAAAAMLLTGDHSTELSVGSSPAQPQNVHISQRVPGCAAMNRSSSMRHLTQA